MTATLQKKTEGQVSALAKRNEALDGILENTCRASGTKHTEVGDSILGQVAECFVERRSADAVDRLSRANSSLEEMAPANLTEAMLAGQMLTANTAAQRFLAFALLEGQTPEGADRNVMRAVRLVRIFIEQLEAMQKLKGKTGQQRVVVEHVSVQQGGQAIVGAVIGAVPTGVTILRQGTPHG